MVGKNSHLTPRSEDLFGTSSLIFFSFYSRFCIIFCVFCAFIVYVCALCLLLLCTFVLHVTVLLPVAVIKDDDDDA